MPAHEPIINTFEGGLNEAVYRGDISNDEVSSCANFIPNRDNSTGSGGIIKREGITRVSSVQTEAWTSVFQGKNATYGTTTTAIRSAAGTSLQAITSSTDPDWESFLGNDIMVNGVDPPWTSTNGTSFAALGGSPSTFKYIEAVNNFLFGAGHSDGILRWADLGTVATWTASNSLTITNQQNNPITGLKRFKNVLLVLTQNDFFHISGTSTGEMNISYSKYGIGCTSHRSVVVVGDEVFWWSNSGIVRSDGFDATYICLPFANSSGRLRGIPTTMAGLNKAKFGLVHATWNEPQECIHFFVHNGSGQATINLRIDYYYKTDTFWLSDGLGTQMGASGRVVNAGIANVYVGSAGTANSYIFKHDNSTILDDTTTITATLDTKNENAGIDTHEKRFKKLTVMAFGTSGAITYTVFSKLRDGTNRTTNFTLSPAASLITLNSSYLNQKYFIMRHQLTESLATGTRPAILKIINEGYVVTDK